MQHHPIAALTVVLVLLAPPARADVLVVDASGGGDFSSLQAAIDAALDGDVLLVRSGAYGALTVDGKALDVFADSGALVRVSGSSTLRNLPAGGALVLSGIEFDGGQPWRATLSVLACAARRRARVVHAARRRRPPGQHRLPLRRGAERGRAARRGVARDSLPLARVRGRRRRPRRLAGGRRGDPRPERALRVPVPVRGRRGRRRGRLDRKAVRQRWAGPLPRRQRVGLGARVRLQRRRGGASLGAMFDDCYEGPPVAGQGVLTSLSGQPRGLVTERVVRAGQTFDLSVFGRVGDEVRLFWTADTGFRFNPFLRGAWLLDGAASTTFEPAGTIGASGSLVVPRAQGALPAGLLGVRMYVQPVLLDVTGRRTLGNPVALLALDGAL
jgi:hypothetical protein